MKNLNLLYVAIAGIAGWFLLSNKSISLPAVKAKQNIINKAYENYYGNGSSTTSNPFGEQHSRTIQEAQTIGAVGGGLTDIWASAKRWLNLRAYEKQLAEIKTAEEADLFFEA